MIPGQPAAVSECLGRVFAGTPALAFAVLIGSRANHTARDGSDWDIAVMWKPLHAMTIAASGPAAGAGFARLAGHEDLRHRLAQCLNVTDDKVDLIDLARASLAMKAAVVEEGQPLAVNDGRAWGHFQTAVWRDLEQHYWGERTHAA